jgi:magnesium transporter
MDPPSQHDLPKIFINDHELVDDEDDDIYRGDRSPSPQTTELGPATSLKSYSTASSGSFRLAGGRLGALATGLERAITRWARKNWADSSSSITSSNSSESSRSSFRTANKSSRRKRRPPSLADIQHRAESERAVAARIRAREIGRIVPREFNLYVPSPSPSQEAGPIEEEQRVVRTFSLDVMLPHLNPQLRKSGKPRRPRHRSRFSRTGLEEPHHSRQLHPTPVHSAMDESSDASRIDAPHGLSSTVEKGKDKMSSTTPPLDPPQTASTFRRDPVAGKPQQAWWLDVSSPSWEDMKTLGRVNSLFLLLMVKLT